MSEYVSIRTYKLKPGVDREAFEKTYASAKPVQGLKRVILLKGYQGDLPGVGKGDVDYVGLHIFESDAGCSRFFQSAVEGVKAGKDWEEIYAQFPAEIQAFVRLIGDANDGTTAESRSTGYTVVHGTI